MSQQAGAVAEQLARVYLMKQGLQWIESNYRCRWGEIDLIMREKKYWVFVEVRARAATTFGGAAASITFSKQQKLIRSATHYLATKKILESYPIRFDVVAMEGKELRIEWIKNAFGVDF